MTAASQTSRSNILALLLHRRFPLVVGVTVSSLGSLLAFIVAWSYIRSR